MLRSIIRFALRQRLLIGGLSLVLIISGLRALGNLKVEAFPDVQDTQVQIISLWPGHAAEELEKQVSLPVERLVNGTPGLASLRSISMLGLSVVTLTFDDDVNDYFARQQVLERLQSVSVPAGVTPQIGALTNASGEIFRYTMTGKRPLEEIKALEDWSVEPALRTVPGVADVVSFGGQVKQYQVDVDPTALRAYGLTLPQVEQAIAAGNANAGGGYITHGYERQVIRGEGLFRNVTDIGDVVVTTRAGIPTRVRDVGVVRIGAAPREGYVARDSLGDVVEGVVMMRKGENPTRVLERVRAKIAEINRFVLPPDVRLQPFYDRGDLVRLTVHTVIENLVIGATLVLVILLLFLGDLRAALIVASVIPLSLLIAFLLMDLRGVSANLISLGAIDFGLLVDAAVVMVEAYTVKLALERPDGDLRKRALLAEVTEQAGRPMLFSVMIVVTAFLPIFTFQRVEKRIFSPMAYTLTFGLLGSLLLALTVIPVLASVFLKARGARHPVPPDAATTPHPVVEHETWATQLLRRGFTPLLDLALTFPKRTVLGAMTLLLIAGVAGTQLGTEFLPALDEGNIWLTVRMPIGVSNDEARRIEQQVRTIVRSYPEVRQIITQLGRPDDGTDVKSVSNLEIYADLTPRGDWRTFTSKEALIAAMNARLTQITGLEFNFSQYIKDNVDEALSGVKGELVVKVFGPDMQVLQDKAQEIKRVLSRVRGVADLAVEQQFGQPQVQYLVDRAALARYGLNVGDVTDAIEAGAGGKAVTQFLEGERLFDVRVRYAAASRSGRMALDALPVNTPDGRAVPLSSVAHPVATEGASRISREMNERRVAVTCAVRGRDEGGFVREAQALVAREVPLPPGYRAVWAGQFENQQRATQRLMVIVPLSLLLIFVLLFSVFTSVRLATMIVSALPFALIGGILVLLGRNIHLSVSAAVGFIALFGIAVQNGVILFSEYERLRTAGTHTLPDAVREGTLNRLRPVVMTAMLAAIGLMPAALSTGVGAETTRPFASVIVGGLVSSTALTLLVLPILYLAFQPKTIEEQFPE